MPGLFTLNSADLGRLNEDVLGGFGTGFVSGSVVSSGTVAGVQGFSGSASGSVTSAGSVSGAAGFVGSVSGVGVSSGSVTGVEGNTGTVAGSVTSAGSVSGAVGFAGVVTGITADTGSVSGSPALTGSVIGGSVSSGSVSGSGPQPPAPAPTPSEGGGRWYLPPAPLLRFVGFVRGLSRSSGSTVAGSFEASSSVVTVSRSDGFVTGFAEIVIPVVIPVRDSVAERQAAEEEILTLMGL